MPLLSRQHLQVHREHPPECTVLSVVAPVTSRMLSQFGWLARLAKDMKELEIRLPEECYLRRAMGEAMGEVDYDSGGLDPANFIGRLSELLEAVRIAAPQFMKLSVGELKYSTGAVLESCISLTQLTKLALGEVELGDRRNGPGTSVLQIMCLANLQALEVRNFHETSQISDEAEMIPMGGSYTESTVYKLVGECEP